jgi:16S rRNA (cytosine1407-C5)-methyltransferase
MELPREFVERMNALLGSQAEAFFDALKGQSPVSVRINPLKCRQRDVGWLPKTDAVPWSSHGYYLSERPSFTFDPLFHAGCYYVQEASSMFVEQAFNRVLSLLDNPRPVVLDLCAAPGGKSTLLATKLSGKGLLVANEINRTRANILAENLIKWGDPNVVVTQSDPASFSDLDPLFDVVLADVPCSGEGMFRKDPEAIREWSVDNVRLCSARQRTILKDVWDSLKPGGFVIYSTCTYNLMENEENVRWICEDLGAELLEIPTMPDWNISGALGEFAHLEHFPVYRFLPHRINGEGFFLALLRKSGDFTGMSVQRASLPKMKIEKDRKQPTVDGEAKRYVANSTNFEWYVDRLGRMVAFPVEHFSYLKMFEPCLKIIHAGVATGERKGKDLIPDTSLALSVSLNRSVPQSVNLTVKEAIDFLRRDVLVLPEEAPTGWVLVCYEGLPLGWIKNLGNRANNNYPNEWRIRSDNPYR